MSKIEVNTVEPQCGTTLTLGACGQTVALGSGASQTGFGRTGTVDWDTTPKTATFTAVSGNGYFCNTTAGVFNITMPASPSAGDIVALKDYAATFSTYALTIDRNGSKLSGTSANYVVNIKNTSLTIVYVDGTQGWVPTEEGTGFLGVSPLYVTATGGTPCTGTIVCTNYKVHTFTGPGNFIVSCAGSACGSNTVDYLVVAGGGGGGSNGGGGGSGGYRFSNGTASGCYTTAPGPLAPLGAGALPVSATTYPIVIGGGGAGNTGPPYAATKGSQGDTSTFSTIDSAGGGGGGSQNTPVQGGGSGGSGGGGGQADAPTYPTKGDGDTPPTSPAQGFDGGSGSKGGTEGGGGGGGGGAAGGAALPACSSPVTGGAGGTGIASCITASPVARGGGGGGTGTAGNGAGGTGGGGAGQAGTGTAGTINTGGGGGGSQPTCCGGGAGGSGIVIIRYKFQ